jgi:tRNA-Thr(GGU) m(6)t(6)A37 methyltransferase TsaA
MTDVVRLKARAAVRRRYEERDDLKGMSPMNASKKNVRTRIPAKEVLPAQLRPIGVIRSRLKERSKAPKQGSEGAPDAWLEVCPFAAQGLNGLAVGDDVIILTWLHRAHRDVLKVHPRSDPGRPLTGVFATRSPDRPNPIGLHRVTVRKIASNRLRVGPIEAIDGTPVIDIKPILCQIQGG